jgi:DNA-binding XRE family transcriptional regulator
MTYHPQRITTPDGTALIVLTEHEYERLLAEAGLDQDARDIRSADRALAESSVRYPEEVVEAMLEGVTPLAAWRRFRGLSQSALAKASGLSQTGVARIERGRAGEVLGRRATRQALARALDVPLAALDPIDD